MSFSHDFCSNACCQLQSPGGNDDNTEGIRGAHDQIHSRSVDPIYQPDEELWLHVIGFIYRGEPFFYDGHGVLMTPLRSDLRIKDLSMTYRFFKTDTTVPPYTMITMDDIFPTIYDVSDKNKPVKLSVQRIKRDIGGTVWLVGA